MGNILIIVGIAGLLLTAVAAPIAAMALRRQVKQLSERIQQEYDQT